jgi:hypothetical protein
MIDFLLLLVIILFGVLFVTLPILFAILILSGSNERNYPPNYTLDRNEIIDILNNSNIVEYIDYQKIKGDEQNKKIVDDLNNGISYGKYLKEQLESVQKINSL